MVQEVVRQSKVVEKELEQKKEEEVRKRKGGKIRGEDDGVAPV